MVTLPTWIAKAVTSLLAIGERAAMVFMKTTGEKKQELEIDHEKEKIAAQKAADDRIRRHITGD